jgi:hypothetical protein
MISPMNPLDRKLADVFRALTKRTHDSSDRQKVSKNFQEIRERIVDNALCERIDLLFTDFSRPVAERYKPVAKEALESIRALRDRGFSETAALLFSAWHDATDNMTVQEALHAAPTVSCFSTWAKTKKIAAEQLQKSALVRPDELYSTVGADWLLTCAKPCDLLPLLDLFLARRPRPNYLPQWNEALINTLKKDKRGNLVSFVLQHSWPSEDPLRALSEAARSNRTAFRTAIDRLPGIMAGKESGPSSVIFVESLFSTVLTTDGIEREFMSAAMAHLGSGIVLADRRGQHSDAVLRLIQQLTCRLKNLTRDEAQERRTWLLENLGHKDEPPDGKLRVTLDGARHLALAFQKAEQGFAVKDILTVTALNLGLLPIGNKGETVAYNPLQHQDIEGGLLPGEDAIIEESGWAIREEPLIRAKVKRAQGGQHV